MLDFNFLKLLENKQLYYSLIITGFFVYILILRIVHFKIEKIVSFFTKKTQSDIDDLILKRTKNLFFYLFIFLGSCFFIKLLYLPPKFERFTLSTIKTIITLILGLIVYRISSIILENRITKTIKEKGDEGLYNFFLFIKSLIRITIIILVFFQIMSIWDVNITPLLASAGIASLAIALAAQQLISICLEEQVYLLTKL